MKNKANKVNYKDLFLMVGIGLFLAAALAVNYCFQWSDPIRILLWLVWLIISLSAFIFTEKGQEFYEFAKSAKNELQKVVWPTRQETVQTTSIVVVMVGISGFALWAIDSAMMWAIGKITHLS